MLALSSAVAFLSSFGVSAASGMSARWPTGISYAVGELLLHATQTILWYQSVDGLAYSNNFWWGYLVAVGSVRAGLVWFETTYLPNTFGSEIDDVKVSEWGLDEALAGFGATTLLFILRFVSPWWLFAPVNYAWKRRVVSARLQLENAVVAIRHQHMVGLGRRATGQPSSNNGVQHNSRRTNGSPTGKGRGTDGGSKNGATGS